MAMRKFKMYMVVGTGSLNSGDVFLSAFAPELKASPSDNLVGARLIREIDCEFDVPDFDLRAMEIAALEDCVQAERADSQVRINILLDRLSKLKCLTHDLQGEI